MLVPVPDQRVFKAEECGPESKDDGDLEPACIRRGPEPIPEFVDDFARKAFVQAGLINKDNEEWECFKKNIKSRVEAPSLGSEDNDVVSSLEMEDGARGRRVTSDGSCSMSAEQVARGLQQPEIDRQTHDEGCTWYLVSVTSDGEVSYEVCVGNYMSLLRDRLSTHPSGKPTPQAIKRADRTMKEFLKELDIGMNDIAQAVRAAFILCLGSWAGRKMALISNKAKKYPEGFEEFVPPEKPSEGSKIPSLYKLLGDIADRVRLHQPELNEYLERVMVTMYQTYYHHGQYLVNYTKKQYVKTKPLASAAAALAVWEPTDHRRTWAGGELAIVSAAAFRELRSKDVAWKDVSEDVEKFVKVIPEADNRALEGLDAADLVVDCMMLRYLGKRLARKEYGLRFREKWIEFEHDMLKLDTLLTLMDSCLLYSSNEGSGSNNGVSSEVNNCRIGVTVVAELVVDCMMVRYLGKKRAREEHRLRFAGEKWEEFEHYMCDLHKLLKRLSSRLEHSQDEDSNSNTGDSSEDDDDFTRVGNYTHGSGFKRLRTSMREEKQRLGVSFMAPGLFTTLPAAMVIAMPLATSRELLFLAVAICVVVCLLR